MGAESLGVSAASELGIERIHLETLVNSVQLLLKLSDSTAGFALDQLLLLRRAFQMAMRDGKLASKHLQLSYR
jgi:hypothetical protein